MQLRKVTYVPGSFQQESRIVKWTSRNIQHLEKLLYQYDLSQDFTTLLAQSKLILRNTRSYQRVTGVFTSMVSVKSGEVGTKKGDEKTLAIKKVQSTFAEIA